MVENCVNGLDLGVRFKAYTKRVNLKDEGILLCVQNTLHAVPQKRRLLSKLDLPVKLRSIPCRHATL